jgi:hypothetical protein
MEKSKPRATTTLQTAKTVERNVSIFIFKSKPFWSKPGYALKILVMSIMSILADPEYVIGLQFWGL